ncbi:MAG TPA: FliH/SctL family protein [Terriglobales bacterium]|nr:FliH/SctL family protein [Terriglobales bacterium]
MSAEGLVRAARFITFKPAAAPERASPSRPAVLEALELARASARREGLDAGREEGRAAALVEWGPRLATVTAALGAAVAELRAERERIAAELSEAVPAAVIALARQVLGRELALGDGAVRAAASTVARQLTERGTVVVRLAPEVAAALRAWRDTGAGAALDGAIVHADASLAPGDWLLETEGGYLDGRLATQLEEALALITEADG